MRERIATGPFARRHGPAHRIIAVVGRRVQLHEALAFQRCRARSLSAPVPRRISRELLDRAVDRARRTDRRWVVRVGSGRHRRQRSAGACVAPRLIGLARRGRRAEARARHHTRREEHRAHQPFPRLPARALEHRAGDRVALIRVDDFCPWRRLGPAKQQPFHELRPLLGGRAVPHPRIAPKVRRRLRGRAAAMREQLFQRRRRPLRVHRVAQLGKNRAHGAAPLELAAFDQDRRQRRRHRLRARADVPAVVERDRFRSAQPAQAHRGALGDRHTANRRRRERGQLVLRADFFERLGQRQCSGFALLSSRLVHDSDPCQRDQQCKRCA